MKSILFSLLFHSKNNIHLFMYELMLFSSSSKHALYLGGTGFKSWLRDRLYLIVVAFCSVFRQTLAYYYKIN